MPPVNDLIANATLITASGSYAGTTVGAGYSDEIGPDYVGYNQPSVWYRIEVPGGWPMAHLVVEVDGATGYYPYYEFASTTGSPDPPSNSNPIGYDGDWGPRPGEGQGVEDGSPHTYAGNRSLVGGTIVYLYISNWNFDASEGAFTLNVTLEELVVPPPNNNIFNAINLPYTLKGCDIAGTTDGATAEAGEIAGAFGATNASVWYRMYAYAFGGRDPLDITFDIDNGGADVNIELFRTYNYNPSFGSLTLLSSDGTNPVSLTQQIETNNYGYVFIRVSSPPGSEADFTLSWTTDTLNVAFKEDFESGLSEWTVTGTKSYVSNGAAWYGSNSLKSERSAAGSYLIKDDLAGLGDFDVWYTASFALRIPNWDNLGSDPMTVIQFLSTTSDPDSVDDAVLIQRVSATEGRIGKMTDSGMFWIAFLPESFREIVYRTKTISGSGGIDWEIIYDGTSSGVKHWTNNPGAPAYVQIGDNSQLVDTPLAFYYLDYLKIFPAESGSPPANDDFANAITISGDTGSQSGDITFANAECGESIEGDYSLLGANSVWYRWTPSHDGQAHFIFTALSDFEWGTEMGIFIEDGLADVTNLDSRILTYTYSDSAPPWQGNGSGIFFHAESAQEYIIMVRGLDGSPGTFTFDWELSSGTPPANDDFVNAETITPTTPGGGGVAVGATIEGATREYPTEPPITIYGGGSAEFFHQSIWYTFEVLYTGTARFWITNPSAGLALNILIAALYRGNTLGGLTKIFERGFSTDPDPYFSLYANLEPGTYHLRIASRDTWGTFDLNYELQLQTVPPGTTGGTYFNSSTDAFTDDSAVTIVGDVITASGSGSVALLDAFPITHSPHGVWHRFYFKRISGDHLYRSGGERLGLFRALNDVGAPVFGIGLQAAANGQNKIVLWDDLTGDVPIAVSSESVGDHGKSLQGEHLMEIFYSQHPSQLLISVDGHPLTTHNFYYPSWDNGPITSYELGFFEYPGASTPPADNWEFEFRDLVISDDASVGPIGPIGSGYLGVTFHHGWTAGRRYIDGLSPPQFEDGMPALYTAPSFSTANTSVVAAPGGWYGKALRIYDATPSNVGRGVSWLGYHQRSTAIYSGNARPSEHNMPSDTTFPGYYIKFQVNALPNIKTRLAQFNNTLCVLMLHPSGLLTLYVDRPTANGSLYTEHTIGTVIQGQMHEVQIQMDQSTIAWKAKAWFDGLYKGQFASNTTATRAANFQANPDVLFYTHDPVLTFTIGKLECLASNWSTYVAISIDIYFLTVATTRMKNSMPLPSLTTAKAVITASGDHVLKVIPEESTFTNLLADPTFSTLDAIGQPIDWSAYDSFDGAGGGVIVGGSLAGGYDTLTVDTTQTDGPPGLETTPALKAVRNAADQTVEGFGLTNSYYVPLHNDVLCLSFWIKTQAGHGVGTWWRTGGSPYFGSATFVNGVYNGATSGGWDRVHLFWTQWFSSGSSVTTTLQIGGTTIGDVTYIKDPRIVVQGYQDPAPAYYTDDGGTTLIKILEGETVSWSRIDDFLDSTSPDDAVYISPTSTKMWDFAVDTVHPLAGILAGHYLEYILGDAPEDLPVAPEVYSARFMVAASSQTPPPASNRTQPFAEVVAVTADGVTSKWGGRIGGPPMDVDAGYVTRGSFTLPMHLDGTPWNLAKWDDIKLRFGYHESTHGDAAFGSVTSPQYAAAIRGVGVELLVRDTPLLAFITGMISMRWRRNKQL